MSVVRMSITRGARPQPEWLGEPRIIDNHIERTVGLTEEAYQRIEAGIAQGYFEGALFLEDGSKLRWFLDGPAPAAPAKRTAPPIMHRSEQGLDAKSPKSRGPKLDVGAADVTGGYLLAQFPIKKKEPANEGEESARSRVEIADHEESAPVTPKRRRAKQ